MVNFNELKSRLQKLQGTDIVISTVGMVSMVMGLEKCIVLDYIGKSSKGISICNLNNVMDDSNPISINIKEENIKDFEVVECNDNDELVIQLLNGETMIIVGCGI